MNFEHDYTLVDPPARDRVDTNSALALGTSQYRVRKFVAACPSCGYEDETCNAIRCPVCDSSAVWKTADLSHPGDDEFHESTEVWPYVSQQARIRRRAQLAAGTRPDHLRPRARRQTLNLRGPQAKAESAKRARATQRRAASKPVRRAITVAAGEPAALMACAFAVAGFVGALATAAALRFAGLL